MFIIIYHWPAQWASIVLLAGVCRRRHSSSVTLPESGPAGRRVRRRSTLLVYFKRCSMVINYDTTNVYREIPFGPRTSSPAFFRSCVFVALFQYS